MIQKIYEVYCDNCGDCIKHYMGKKPTMEEFPEGTEKEDKAMNNSKLNNTALAYSRLKSRGCANALLKDIMMFRVRQTCAEKFNK